jgi:type IV pilus assembly protein PilQ
MVAPATEIADRERIELENTQKMQDLAPVYTEHFRVNYADAEEINTLFQAMSDDTTSGLLSGRGSAIVDQRTNSIIMTDTQAKLDEFRDLLEKLDIPVRQVSIEARIVLANAGVSRDLGVRWGYDYQRDVGSGRTGLSTGTVDGIVDMVNGDPLSYGDAPGGLVVDLAASPSSASSFAVGLLTGGNNFLTLELSALEAEGRGEVISQPRVIAGNQQKAIIQSGSEIPYQQATSSGATAVQFKEATLKLEVTPLITPDNRIIMELIVTKDSIGEVVAGVPTIDVTQLETSVIADNGQTIVLGGIFEQAVVESEEKTPILGDIPFLGNLFKRTSRSNDKRETLIFITPRIMDEPTATQ